jgi:hypothetical protein
LARHPLDRKELVLLTCFGATGAGIDYVYFKAAGFEKLRLDDEGYLRWNLHDYPLVKGSPSRAEPEQGILLTRPSQSEKLIAVWRTLEPLPLVAFEPLSIIVGLFLFAIGHAFVYKWLSVGWPRGVAPRALRLGV